MLQHLGLTVDAPAFHPARPPPQPELRFGDELAAFYPDAPAAEDLSD